MSVLSCFDGMSGGRMALDEAGISYDEYYTSEIDKYSSAVAKFIYPDSIHLGDITKWQQWNIPRPTLLIGGSPCTNLSFAGKQRGLSTDCKIDITTLEQYLELRDSGFKFHGQSYLFWEFIAIREYYKPKYFFLENVMFVKKWRDVFNEAIGFPSTVINSALVSAQNRKRQYWLSELNAKGGYDEIPIEQPEDRGILLKHIVEEYTTRDKQNWDTIAVVKNRGELQPRNDKSNCIDANYHKGADNHGQRTQIVTGCHHVANASDINGHDSIKRIYADSGKSPTLNSCTGGNREPKILVDRPASIVGRRLNERGVRDDYNKDVPITQCLQVKHNPNKTGTLTTVDKDNVISNLPPGRYPNAYDKPNTLTYRKLTPLECERLQTVGEHEQFIKVIICSDLIKNFVNVVNKNPKLLKLVLNAEKTELPEYVKYVVMNMSVKNLLKDDIVHQNVDTVEKRIMSSCQKQREDSAEVNVFINIIQGKIQQHGKVGLPQNVKSLDQVKNGRNVLELSILEIMELVKDVELETKVKRDIYSTSTILDHSNVKNIEQILITLFYFVKSVTDGFILNETINLNLSFYNRVDDITRWGILNDKFVEISSSQRYKMIGNGFNITTIAHILSHLPKGVKL